MQYNTIEDKSMNEYTHKNGIVYKNQFHIIFSPKYRKPVLTGNVEINVKQCKICVKFIKKTCFLFILCIKWYWK